MQILFAGHKKLSFWKIFAIILLAIFISDTVSAQNFHTDKITYHNQNLRMLADKYFGNADLWETILKYNNLHSPVELKEGMQLTIPSELVKRTISAIDETHKTIDRATENGAKIFTPDLLDNALSKLNQSIAEKDKWNWFEANRLINDALGLAGKSLEESQLLRNQSADATLSFVKGDVQSRKPSQRLWSEADLYEKLYEDDRTRTLTESFAEITFIDLSRVRLNENSQALIQRSRVDLLSNKTETTVRLIKGDAFAYLLKSPKKKFDIDVPGLDTKIRSKSFWIEKQKDTKIANYEGEIELEARGTKVIVKENQGSVIPEGGPPSEPKDLLSAPGLTSPLNSVQIYANDINFKWEPVDSARQYWFEIAGDALFQNLVYSSKNIKNTEFHLSAINPGVYYWHVASIDSSGFPGDFADYRYLNLIEDNTKPFLRIISPKSYSVTREKNIDVRGETEKDAVLTINDQNINVNDDGSFSKTYALTDGYNKFSIVSEDKASNKTVYSVQVIYESNPQVELEYLSGSYNKPGKIFVAAATPLIIKGTTRPLSEINVESGSGEIIRRTYADTTGFFMYSLDRIDIANNPVQLITTPAGYTRSDSLRIQTDNTPPEIIIEEYIPRSTADNQFTLNGKTKGAHKLLINNESVEITGNSFSQTIELHPGANNIMVTAYDNAGNTAAKTFSINLDTNPPELISHKIIRSVTDPARVQIEVAASDKSGMRKAAECKLTVDGRDMKKILLLNAVGNKYELQFVLSNPGASVKLKTVTLEDYLKNKREYVINKN